MGLTNWKNSPDGLIYKYDVGVAKNYLNEDEYEKFRIKQDKEYISSMNEMYNRYLLDSKK